MSTFSTKGGLYEKAQHRFGVSNGKQLFTYSFYEKHKTDAQVRMLEGQDLTLQTALKHTGMQ